MADSTTTTTVDDKAYISTARGVAGGYAFVAPVGTTVPTDSTTALNSAFKSLGRISEDGITAELDGDSEDYKDMNGDVVFTSTPTRVETYKIKLLNVDETALKVQYGSANVTKDSTTGAITIDHKWANLNDSYAVVFELLLKNGRHWRIVIPVAKVTEVGELAIKSTELIGREVTFKAMNDGTGSCAKDYIGAVVTD